MTVTYRYVLTIIMIAMLLTIGVMDTQDFAEIPYFPSFGTNDLVDD